MQSSKSGHVQRVMNSLGYTPLIFLAYVASSTAQPPSSPQALLDNYTPVTLEELAAPPADDWLMWRRTANHWGYSPLDQINKTNVGSLRLAWACTMEPGV